MSDILDREKRRALASTLTDFHLWQDIAEQKGWVIPLGSAIGAFPATSWIEYWKAMDAKEKGLIEGRPVPPHR